MGKGGGGALALEFSPYDYYPTALPSLQTQVSARQTAQTKSCEIIQTVLVKSINAPQSPESALTALAHPSALLKCLLQSSFWFAAKCEGVRLANVPHSSTTLLETGGAGVNKDL